MIKREIWIRINNKSDIAEVQQFILSLGFENLLGEIPVVLYDSSTRSIEKQSHIYDVCSSAVNVLKEKYGENNVEYTDREDDHVPKGEVLDRIATALEELNDKLSSVTDCVEYMPPRYKHGHGYNFFRIGGQVDAE